MPKTFSKGGVHPPENKITAGSKIQQLDLPKVVNIPLYQHLGAPAKPLVQKGDKVRTGQLIAEADGFISANIHATVSGTVLKIDKFIDTSGYKRDSITINVEGDEWIEDIDREESITKEISLSSQEIIKRVKNAGIVGLGGATFPTNVKLTIPRGKKATMVIINGVECEPYLTSDHMLMLEKTEEILVSLQILMKALKVHKGYIGIENNKADVIELMQNLASDYKGIRIVPLQVKYPQGGEKQLIKAVINREVPPGGLPVDVGAVVFNVGTTFAVYEAVQKNKPLIERIVTITGKDLKRSANFRVRIGTSVSELINAAGGLPDNTGKVIIGGPMMGKALADLSTPIVKGSSGILILPKEESSRKEILPCIRCAKCVSVCPMGLEPYLLMAQSERNMDESMEGNRVLDCIECGACAYICPASRPLLDYIRLGKRSVNQLIRSRKH